MQIGAYRIFFHLVAMRLRRLQQIDPAFRERNLMMTTHFYLPQQPFVTGKTRFNTGNQRDSGWYGGSTWIFFEKQGKFLEASRLKSVQSWIWRWSRAGISGWKIISRYFDRRSGIDHSVCMDYFPEDFLLVHWREHVTIRKFGPMWGGRSVQKVNLRRLGFRLSIVFG